MTEQGQQNPPTTPHPGKHLQQVQKHEWAEKNH